MRWRFLIVNLAYGEVTGTSNENETRDFEGDNDSLVIDVEKGVVLDKAEIEIKEYDPDPTRE